MGKKTLKSKINLYRTEEILELAPYFQVQKVWERMSFPGFTFLICFRFDSESAETFFNVRIFISLQNFLFLKDLRLPNLNCRLQDSVKGGMVSVGSHSRVTLYMDRCS